MRRNLYLICRIAAFAALLVPAMTRAENYSFRYRGNAAYASVSKTDGCITTWIDVSFAESRYQDPPGQPDAGASAHVYVSQFDWCQYTSLLDAFGQSVLPQSAFQINGSLQSAHVSTTIQAFDSSSGTAVPIVVDLTWTGTGSAFRSHYSNWARYPTYSYRSHATGEYRYADISGSIAAGTLSVAVTPETSWGDLYSSSSGSVSITR